MKFEKIWQDSSAATDTGSNEALLSGSSGVEYETTHLKKRRCSSLVLTLCNVLLLCVSIGFFIASSSRECQSPNHDTTTASKDDSAPEAIKLGVSTKTLDGTVSISNDTAIVWGTIGSKAEAAWEDFEKIRLIPLTEERVVQTGKDISILAKFDDPTWHLGEDAYIGSLDIFHQVHCLNELRKKAFRDHPSHASSNYSEFTALDWVHLQHCISMTMQHLLCTADDGVLTYNWMEGQQYPLPDFSVNRQCRDWTQLTKYRDDHGVDRSLYKDWKIPADAVVLPRSKDMMDLDALFALEEDGNGHHDHK